MKKKTIILLISILLAFIIGLNFNFNYASDSVIYTDLLEYKSSDITSSNSAYVANLAREYIKVNKDMISAKDFNLTNDIFNNAIITILDGSDLFSVSFNNTGFYNEVSSGYNFIKNNTHKLTIYLGNGSAKISYSSSDSRLLYNTAGGYDSEISTQNYYSSLDLYKKDTDNLFLARNMNYNYHYMIPNVPNLTYAISEQDYGYQISVTPYDVSFPYDLFVYYSPDYTSDEPLFLETEQTTLVTSKFVVPKATSKVLIVCESLNGASSLEVNLETLNIDKKCYLEVNTIPAYVSGHSLDKTYIKSFNMKEGYNIYWSYSTLLVKDNTLNYSINNNNYEVETEVDFTTLYFFITNENGKIIYTLKHNKQDGSFSSTNGEMSSSDYTDLIVDEPPKLPEDAGILDYIKYFFNMIGWGIAQLLEFLKKIMTYVVDIGGIFSKCFNFFPSPIPQLFTIGIISVIIISLIKIARK